MNEGDVVSTTGLNVPVTEYDHHFEEQHVPHSTALHASDPERTSYLVGPSREDQLVLDHLSPSPLAEGDAAGSSWPIAGTRSRHRSRGLEMIHAYEEALSILQDYQPTRPATSLTNPNPAPAARHRGAARAAVPPLRDR